MRVSATVLSGGGGGDTIATANQGGLPADAGPEVHFMALGSQPALSSYDELLATELIDLDQILSLTAVPNLDIVVSTSGTQFRQERLLPSATESHMLRRPEARLVRCVNRAYDFFYGPDGLDGHTIATRLQPDVGRPRPRICPARVSRSAGPSKRITR